jgi:hypothetical protein
MIEYLTLILAIPLGIILAKTTHDEKPIYTKYFPSILWILAIAAAILYTLDKTIALTLIFTFITTLVWHKA